MSFNKLGLSAPILKAIEDRGYTEPSPIQAQAIPPILEGLDVMAAAQTGTGKTAGFTLPLLELLSHGENAQSNQVRALVLTPTRELAAQVAESVKNYGQHLSLKSTVVFGGVKINPQMMALRRGADILIATPGRMMDLYNQKAVRFDKLEILVLDEADRMLDMGFIHDIKKILAILPKKRQNLLFSATFSPEIRQLAKGLVNNPVEISVTPRNATAVSVEQWLHPVDKKRKTELLIKLIADGRWDQALVFSRTKHGANKITKTLEDAGIRSSAIHGNKSQGARTRALADFKEGRIRILVATDIAARGLDIEQLPHVVNFDLPDVAEDYVHRIGRTGRAGATGKAISLVAADELDLLRAIERLTQKLIERRYEDDFMPTHMLPDTTLDNRPIKKNNPKRPNNPGAPRQGNGAKQGGNANKQGNAPKSGNRRPTDRGNAPAKADVTQGQGLRSKPLAPARRNRKPTQD
ncbi:DEAD/DEAH box helicase [Marinomonas primoryensis]|mgnify:FL=1|jgi:ATP-dependent RNA helicase RhlE|uniref:ATP-dependent RNA helicase RhlE n=1 Tax=Marinomonas primoryensis TaxID=178399 RepID=A0A859CT80_9GAMM|nr:DEAD/DEAH box helicase [Marinomonas primoryensis]QKK79408.1 ATP-dependent RNA helicase RhlE [Marinomonas primoryensis]